MALDNSHTEAGALSARRSMLFRTGIAVLLALGPGTACASGAVAAPDTTPLTHFDDELQTLHKELLELNRDLVRAEEDLLFPPDTRLTVFVSLDTGLEFVPGSVQLKLDNVLVASEVYGPDERRALQRGGAQRLYVGSLRSGAHSLSLFFAGTGADGQAYRRGTTVKIDKARGARILEFRIRDPERTRQPVAQLKDWR